MTGDAPTPLGALAARWPEVDRLLDAALALPPPQRQGWLQSLPVEHASLKDTLARLLEVHDDLETGEFLGRLPQLDGLPGDGTTDAAIPKAGDEVGPYRLIRELGEGGMGSVWLAERADGLLKRQVALKLPRLTWARGLAERMARERDILATLDHPHIARLHDAGVDALGRPWLALEYVAGRPIDVHCRDRSLDIRARVGLLVQVCEAVAYAHRRLVIHRDLKPANILVTDDGQVRLLDFGIAKLVQGEDAAPTALTALAGRAMTLDYASPEQVRGEPLTTASDVYSLGVVAYELLAGRRPYQLRRGSAAELEEAIASADVVAPSTVAPDAEQRRALRGDLDAIVHNALQKRAEQRYPTVDALGADLRRHLAGDAIEARRDTWWARIGRMARRQRIPLAATGLTLAAFGLAIGAGATALVVLVLLAGLAAAAWQARDARRAATQAQQEARTARAVQAFIESVFLASSGDQAAPGAARAATARELLDRGAERIAHELQDAPAALQRLLGLMAGVYEDLTEFERAAALQERRLAVARQAAGAGSDEEILALADLAHALSLVGRKLDALRQIDLARERLRSRPDASTAVRLRVALRRAAARLQPAGDEALALAEEALALARTLPPSAEFVMALHSVGENAVYAGRPERAAAALEEALAVTQARPELGANMRSAMQAALADVRAALGDTAAAEALYRAALDAERRRDSGPAMRHYLELKLGLFLARQSRWLESAEVLAAPADHARAQTGVVDPTWPMALVARGRALVAGGHVDAGLAELDDAARLASRLQDSPEVQGPLVLFRAQACIHQGRLDEALTLIEKGSELIGGHPQQQERLVLPARREWQIATGRGAEALADWQANRRQANLPPTAAHDEAAGVLALAAELHRCAGQLATARAQAESALEAVARRPDDPTAGTVRAQAGLTLGLTLVALGQEADAVPVLARAVGQLRQVQDPLHSLRLADALGGLARAQERCGDRTAGQEARAEALAIHARQQHVGPHHRRAVEVD